MSPRAKPFVPLALAIAIAVVTHVVAGRLLASRDAVAAVLRIEPVSLGAAVLLLATRLFLLFVAPAWGLYRGVQALVWPPGADRA